MMEGIGILGITALSIGFVHTILGPDHYLPFIAMARAGGWSLQKTVLVTLLCGLGHVLSSVVLGFLGIAFGIAVLKLENIEAFRGDVAGWLLIVFGLIYCAWGLRHAIRNQPHTHLHAHANGTLHAHKHVHRADHLHAHANMPDTDQQGHIAHLDHASSIHQLEESKQGRMTPWILFVIFLFGPCEPLIPLLMYPAAKGNLSAVLCVTTLFGVTTLATMTAIVVAAYVGAKAVPFARFQRYGHAVAGFVVLACGIVVKTGL